MTREESERYRREAMAKIAEIQRYHAELVAVEVRPWIRILERLPSPPMIYVGNWPEITKMAGK